MFRHICKTMSINRILFIWYYVLVFDINVACCACWCSLLFNHIQDDTLLVIGWGTSVKIAVIRTNQNKGVNGTYKHIPMSSLNQVDIVASFQTSYFISGIAPFGDTLVILAYIPGEDREKDFSSTVPSRQVCVCVYSQRVSFFFHESSHGNLLNLKLLHSFY